MIEWKYKRVNEKNKLFGYEDIIQLLLIKFNKFMTVF